MFLPMPRSQDIPSPGARSAGGRGDLEAPERSALLRRQSSPRHTLKLSVKIDPGIREAASTPKRQLEVLLQSPELADKRLSRSALEKCRRKLLDVIAGRPEIEGGINEELENVVIYKGRALFSARLLHFAVWCAAQAGDARLVEQVLPYLGEGEVFTKAKYRNASKGGWSTETWLDVMHIAAGLGSVPVMEAVLTHVTMRDEGYCHDPATYLSSFCVVHRYETGNHKNCQSQDYYMPIHDATFAGHSNVVMWLLKHSADANSANKDGVRPLHFLAMRGVSGGVDCDKRMRELVKAMRRAGATLDAKIPEDHYDPELRGKSPLELAAADTSRFPKRLLGMLVPCLEEEATANLQFFSNVAFLSRINTDATEQVVRELARRSDVLASLRLDAQMPGRTDLMASILYLAPSAGGTMLDLLMAQPEIQDAVKHNIPARTSLWGIWRNDPMRCTYQPDATKGSEGVMTPTWKFDSSQMLEDQPEIKWHQRFLPNSGRGDVRSEHVYNVSVTTLLMPNALDIDIFMALARTRQDNLGVFARLSVQGMIYCLWDNLVHYVWLTTMVYQMLELGALLHLGFGGREPIAPLSLVLIASGGLRELASIASLTAGCVRKWRVHSDPPMKSLWHPLCSIVMSWVGCSLVLCASQMKLAWDIWRAGGEDDGLDEMLLACCVLFKCFVVTYMFRLSPGGIRIHAIVNSFIGGATKEMLYITLAIFTSFCVVFVMLARGNDEATTALMLASSYRGLLFGDGDGFNNLGMNVGDEGSLSDNSTIFCVVGSFFFNIIILNLIIAVYGNEYDRVVGETPLLFAQARARNCVMYILSCDSLPWLGSRTNVFLRCLAVGTGAAVIAVAAVGAMQILAMAFLLALAQMTLQSSLIQCSWFSAEGHGADGEDYFVWFCHRSDFLLRGSYEDPVTRQHLEEQLQDVASQVRRQFRFVDDRLGGLEAKIDQLITGVAATPPATTSGWRTPCHYRSLSPAMGQTRSEGAVLPHLLPMTPAARAQDPRRAFAMR